MKSGIAATVTALLRRLPSGSGPASAATLLVPPLVEAMAEDARDNARGLPLYANHLQFKANLLTALSNTLAALTGLAIWTVLQRSSAWWAQAAVALAALTSAVLGFLPGIYRWNENAGTARRLASEYGHLYGDLLDLKGRFLKDPASVPDGDVKEARTRLEGLKKQRQEINAYWK
ncbi:hypothetical protein [Nucisporomicrobium flavum]|uniref:hypothetical protein n=1 Tax=Nucisporomicrobium flavum TaxID=2785915 RepID=UPI0018F5EA0E|nr:hypothetical protein [Nucisporomicrobium flavum]